MTYNKETKPGSTLIENQGQLITPEVLQKESLFVNIRIGSDWFPYEIVKASKTGKTVYIREMIAEIKTKQAFSAGGFSSHCLNNSEQDYFYSPNVNAPVFSLRINKNGLSQAMGKATVCTKPRRFYDFNF